MIRARYPLFDSYDHVDADCGEVTFPRSIDADQCPCCTGSFVHLEHHRGTASTLGLAICGSCGWWHLHVDTHEWGVDDGKGGIRPQRGVTARWWELHYAVIEKVDLAGLQSDDLGHHLARNWDQRVNISAQQAEDLVAGVLKEYYGGEVLRTSANTFAADGGIDLVVAHDAGVVRRAVQIKRRLTGDPESVKDVRNFVGAMLLGGEKQGTFVTTASRFTKPATDIAKNPHLHRARLELELIDGERLLELIEHSALQRKVELPEAMSLGQIWTSANGREIGARELFLGDLRRVAALR